MPMQTSLPSNGRGRSRRCEVGPPGGAPACRSFPARHPRLPLLPSPECACPSQTSMGPGRACIRPGRVIIPRLRDTGQTMCLMCSMHVQECPAAGAQELPASELVLCRIPAAGDETPRGGADAPRALAAETEGPHATEAGFREPVGGDLHHQPQSRRPGGPASSRLASRSSTKLFVIAGAPSAKPAGTRRQPTAPIHHSSSS